MSSDSGVMLESVRGSTLPRVWTRPLVTGPPGPCGCGCALTPDTSYGFDADDFARLVLLHPLDPWQRWLVIHAGELLPDGTPRFSKILVLVARQNGKTHLLVVLALYWLFVERIETIVGTNTKLDYARESWLKAVKLARSVPDLAVEIPKRGGVRKTNGEQELVVAPSGHVDDLDACHYKIAASNEEGGRSLSIGRLILDELRQHHSYEAWDASEPTTSAVEGSQIWALSNAGSDRSVVLNDLRADAVAWIERGEGDDDLMLAEWSSPEDADPTDVRALAQANPNLGARKHTKKLLANARRAVARGGSALTGFKTEHMCIRVKQLSPAIDPGSWLDCLVPGDLTGLPGRALCLDVAPDQQHATLAAAAVMPDGRPRVVVLAAWSGPMAARELVRDLPGWVARAKPGVVGWLPGGPAASIAADVKARPGRKWPPAGVRVEEIRSEVAAVCMGLAELVSGVGVVHAGDPLLDAHVAAAEPLKRGDVWVFSRRGDGHCDAVYAAAGAVHLARTLPAPIGKPRIVSARTPAG